MEKREEGKYGVKGLAEEDVLRSLYESKGEVSFKDLGKELGEESLAKETVKSLLGKGYVRVSGEQVFLTDKGAEKAREIYSLHKRIEDLFSRLGVEDPHSLAHSLEHLALEPDVLSKIIKNAKISKLSELGEDEMGYVLAVDQPKPLLLARLYGTGVLPGRRITVIAKNLDVILVSVGLGSRVVALDRSLSDRILVAAV